jgi:hypothetical protein
MKLKILYLPFVFLLAVFQLFAQECPSSRWELTGDGIRWNISDEMNLPHEDNIEMSGRKISVILHYGLDVNRNLSLSRDLIWPALRRSLREGEPSWTNYRAYFRKSTDSLATPTIMVNGKELEPGAVNRIELEEYMKIQYTPSENVQISRVLFPSMHMPVFLEQWTLENTSGKSIMVSVAAVDKHYQEQGAFELITWGVFLEGINERELKKNEKLSFYVMNYASADKAFMIGSVDGPLEKKDRKEFVDQVSESLELKTPDPMLDMAFRMAKVRCSESLFETKQGLVHSPGGGRYYGGVWANDQVEYAGPFFPFLGYSPANEASLNAYLIFARDMKPDYSPIWSSHEMEGDFPCCGKDRGDAAMYAYGASRFAMGLGDKAVAAELWPAICWSLEYCRRKQTSAGVIASQTDEMEGRIATGDANLSTSTLAYGGLRSAAKLALSLGKTDTAELWDKRADSLEAAIESYFGADIRGYHTYRYFDGHSQLRHWMGLPFTMGIYKRAEGVKNALLNELWTINGLNVETGENMFWDRGTLYALRGILNAGYTKEGMEKLKAYSCVRLLGEHVPYPVEAWPEGDQAHLAAESALYCRIITEGLFGLVPVGLGSFECCPRLPETWDRMELKDVKLFGEQFTLQVEKIKGKLEIKISKDDKTVFKQTVPEGEPVTVRLK